MICDCRIHRHTEECYGLVTDTYYRCSKQLICNKEAIQFASCHVPIAQVQALTEERDRLIAVNRTIRERIQELSDFFFGYLAQPEAFDRETLRVRIRKLIL